MQRQFLQNEFDILFKNFFDEIPTFVPTTKRDIRYPLNIYEDDDLLTFEFVVLDTPKSHLSITTNEQNNVITVSRQTPSEYRKTNDDSKRTYVVKSIVERDFKYSWKINSAFDLSKTNSKIVSGLLIVTIPHSKESIPQQVEIQIEN